MFPLPHPCIILQSDDWGFCAWSADHAAWEKMKPHLPDDRARDYAGSTLESPESMRRLFDVLAQFKGGDGLPARMQGNYIFCAPDYEKMKAEGYRQWRGIELPNVPSRWERGDIIAAAREGISRGVWHAEHHGYTHGNVPILMSLLAEKEPRTLELFDEQSWPLHDSRVYSEYWQTIRPDDVKRGIDLFTKIFGYEPRSTCPPNYIFPNKLRRVLVKKSIHLVQGANRFLPSRPNNLWRRVRRRLLGGPKFSGRLSGLERDIDFEPRGQDPSAANAAWRETYNAAAPILRGKGTAIISTHRLNFIHLDRAWVDAGLEQLRLLLDALQREFPQAIYVSDYERIQLSERGMSQQTTPGRVVLRNLTGEPVQYPGGIFPQGTSVQSAATMPPSFAEAE